MEEIMWLPGSGMGMLLGSRIATHGGCPRVASVVPASGASPWLGAWPRVGCVAV